MYLGYDSGGLPLVAQLFWFLFNKLITFHRGRNWARRTPRPHVYTASCISPKGWSLESWESHWRGLTLDQSNWPCAGAPAAHITGLFCSIFRSSPPSFHVCWYVSGEPLDSHTTLSSSRTWPNQKCLGKSQTTPCTFSVYLRMELEFTLRLMLSMLLCGGVQSSVKPSETECKLGFLS